MEKPHSEKIKKKLHFQSGNLERERQNHARSVEVESDDSENGDNGPLRLKASRTATGQANLCGDDSRKNRGRKHFRKERGSLTSDGAGTRDDLRAEQLTVDGCGMAPRARPCRVPSPWGGLDLVAGF